jgi:16S rRNA A1518/A1519 N6-dimethyltransferase RsmA/KsgA/DIM1 with predicted DNA glycosylase/AP lyase activity
MNPIEKINISRFSFYPPPKINLSLIKLEPRKKINSFLKKEIHIDWFLKFIAGIMPYKNKNLSNAITLFLKNLEHNKISKNAIKNILNENNYPDSKIFTYNMDQLVEISKIFYHLIEK